MNRLMPGPQSKVSSTTLTRLLAIAVALMFAASMPACSKHTSLGGAPPADDEGEEGDKKSKKKKTLSSRKLLQKGGLCEDEREVNAPEKDSEEYVIYRMYELALGANTPEAFDEFAAMYPSKRPRELKELYWPRIRKNVHKFMNEPGKPGYTICRIAKTDKGNKYFIKTSDPKQHPPPITIGEVDGELKIVFLTPF